MTRTVLTASRRDLAGAIGAVLLLTAAEAGSAKAQELDGELLACCAEADRLESRVDALIAKAPMGYPLAPCWHEADRLADEAYTLRERVVGMQARTPEGLQAKARLVLERLESNGLAEDLALSLARDVLGRAAA